MSKTNQNDIGSNNTGAATPPQAGARVSASSPQVASGGSTGGVIDRRRLQELVKEVDPLEQMDDDVEEVRDVWQFCLSVSVLIHGDLYSFQFTLVESFDRVGYQADRRDDSAEILFQYLFFCFLVGAHCEKSRQGQGCPLFDDVHPALPLLGIVVAICPFFVFLFVTVFKKKKKKKVFFKSELSEV